MNQVPVLPALPLLPDVVVQRRRRSASVWPDGAPRSPPCPRRQVTATPPASLSPGPGRRSAPPQHRFASALAAPELGGGCSARERPLSSRRPRLRRSWRPRSLGLGRYLRKISIRLRKHYWRSVGKGSSPTSSLAAVAIDDDAAARRERAEAVARAISYCKDTLRCRSSSILQPPPPPPPTPPPSPSPSFEDWLDSRDRQEEVKVIAKSAAEQHCDDCRDSRPLLTRRPRLDRETRAKRFKEFPCPASSPSRWEDSPLAATAAAAHGEESPRRKRHAHGCRRESSMSSGLDELKFLKTFSEDEEMINRHFVTVEIPRNGCQVLRKQSPPDMKRKRLDMKTKEKNHASVVVPTLNVFKELEN